MPYKDIWPFELMQLHLMPKTFECDACSITWSLWGILWWSRNKSTTLAVKYIGEDASVVSNEVAVKTGIVSVTSRIVRFLNATNDPDIKAFGNFTATIQMANRQYDWKDFTAPTQDPILLGFDFMKAIDVTFYPDQYVIINERWCNWRYKMYL